MDISLIIIMDGTAAAVAVANLNVSNQKVFVGTLAVRFKEKSEFVLLSTGDFDGNLFISLSTSYCCRFLSFGLV